jgi:ribosomal protein L10
VTLGNLDHILAFIVEPDTPQREVRVNFGVFAGRAVTPAEIDELAKLLIPEFGQVSITSEERHELSDQSEGTVQQVRVELPENVDAEQALDTVERWAQSCIDDRHAEVSEL